MSNILIPRRHQAGRDVVKDYNKIDLRDSETINQAKVESWIAKNLGEELAKCYPNRGWAVTVFLDGGMVAIQCHDVSKVMAYHVKLDKPMKELVARMRAIGGEILERGNIPRGFVTEDTVEAVPRDFKDEVKGLDNN